MESLKSFAAMGGYAAFVWPAYAAAAFVMAALCWSSLAAYRRRCLLLETLVARRARDRGAP
jgi:heme exporter protein CcmD